MRILNLTQPSTRRALRHPQLAGKKMLARGTFCAVYDNGPDSVLKLTCDSAQYNFLRWHHHNSIMFPRPGADYRDIGETSDGTTLYLIEVERLTPFSHTTPTELKRAMRAIVKQVNNARMDVSIPGRMSQHDQNKYEWVETLRVLAENESIAQPLRDAYESISIFCSNFDCGVDIQNSNMMLRGDQIIFSDPVCDTQYLFREQRRRRWHG